MPTTINEQLLAKGGVLLGSTSSPAAELNPSGPETGKLKIAQLPAPNAGGHYETSFGDGTHSSFTIIHNLKTLTPDIVVINQSTGLEEGCKKKVLNENEVEVSATAWTTTPPGVAAYRVSVDASSGLVATNGSVLTSYALKSEEGANNGIAPLDSGGLLPSARLPVSVVSDSPNRGAWATGTVFAAEDLTYYRGTAYKCTTAHTAGATFTGANFTALPAKGARTLVVAEPYNSVYFGCDTTGTVSAVAGLQAMLDALPNVPNNAPGGGHAPLVRGDYLIDGPLYYHDKSQLLGEGNNSVRLNRAASFTSTVPMLQPAAADLAAGKLTYVKLAGFELTGNEHGPGLLLTRVSWAETDLLVTYTTLYGVRLIGGTSGGDTMHNKVAADIQNFKEGGFQLFTNASSGSQPDASKIRGYISTASSAAIGIEVSQNGYESESESKGANGCVFDVDMEGVTHAVIDQGSHNIYKGYWENISGNLEILIPAASKGHHRFGTHMTVSGEGHHVTFTDEGAHPSFRDDFAAVGASSAWVDTFQPPGLAAVYAQASEPTTTRPYLWFKTDGSGHVLTIAKGNLA